jgi:hypothetical protein
LGEAQIEVENELAKEKHTGSLAENKLVIQTPKSLNLAPKFHQFLSIPEKTHIQSNKKIFKPAVLIQTIVEPLTSIFYFEYTIPFLVSQSRQFVLLA